MPPILIFILLLVPLEFAAPRSEAAPVPDSDWPHARGPRYDGHVPRARPLPPWPAAGPARRWEQPLGQGFSGLVVSRGSVYTQHQTSSGQELVCLDLATGAVRWRRRYAYPWEMDGKFPGPYGTPTVAGDRVYFSDCYGQVGCARAADGAILWRFDAVKALNPAGVDFGYAATPLVIAGRLYAPAPAGGGDVTVFCLDATSGALLWQAGRSHPSYASCTPLTLGGTDYLLLPLRNGLALFDRRTGAEVWKDEWTRGYDEHSIWPIFREPYLVCSSPFRRGSRVYRLTTDGGRLQVDPVWEERVLSNDVLASAFHDGHLYGFDVQSQQAELRGRTRGTLKCVELATGTVKWTQAGGRHCSVTAVGDRLILLEDDGDLVLVDPSPTAYRELARSPLPQTGKIWAAPVVVGDRLLVRGADRVTCYALTPDVPLAAPAGAAATRPSPDLSVDLGRAIRSWFERYRTDAFIAPSPGTLLEWYLISLGLLGAALGGAAAARRRSRRLDWTWLAAALGLGGTAAFTAASGRFIWVVPLTLYSVFCHVVPAGRDPRTARPPGGGRLRAYAALAGFVALCLLYFMACSALFLVSGWGFLVGFPVVVLLAWAGPRFGSPRWPLHPAFAGGWAVAAFTGYYWTSALAIAWSAR